MESKEAGTIPTSVIFQHIQLGITNIIRSETETTNQPGVTCEAVPYSFRSSLFS
jgi:hypothetical protein